MPQNTQIKGQGDFPPEEEQVSSTIAEAVAQQVSSTIAEAAVLSTPNHAKSPILNPQISFVKNIFHE